jgi:tetratricopeptide (TPR) repeat protein
LRLFPNFHLALCNLGLVYVWQKRYPEAIALFQQAIQLKPSFIDAHLNLALTYAELKLGEKAEQEFLTAINLAPLNFYPRNRLGKFYLDTGQLPEAEEQFRRSVETAPNVEAHDGLGAIHLRRGDHQLAERQFRRAVALEGYDSQARFSLGALYADSGSTAEAIQQYHLGLVTDPANPEALAALRRLGAPVPSATRKNLDLRFGTN